MSLKKNTKRYIEKYCKRNLYGKTALITGANSGIGFKTAEEIVFKGGSVILACRNEKRALEAKMKLLKDYPNANITIELLDLASFHSIENFCNRIIEKKIDIDYFVNNAGVFHKPNEKTEDGYELIIGTNYFGLYRITEKIIPYLLSLNHEVTYINTISIIHKKANIDFKDFYYENNYDNFKVYARSKLCIAKYTNYLVEKYKNTNVKFVMNHPGISLTPIGLNAFGGFVKFLGTYFVHCFNTPEKSALSFLYIVNNDVLPGDVVGPRGLINGWGYPNVNKICPKSKENIKELIEFTENTLNN